MSQVLSTVNSRVVYEQAKKMLADTGVSTATAKLTQSFLRLENPLATNRTQYQFPVLVNQPNVINGIIFNTEQRLNQQDAFVAAAWGVFLANPASATDGTFPLYTWPNPFVFGAAAAAAAETIYNSIFQLAVNNDIVLPAWDVSRHRHVPQTQATAAFAAGSPADMVDLSEDAFYPVEPNLVFIGSKNSVLNLVMPAALASVNTFQRLVVVFRGVLAQNSTIIT